jgi:hypothetical protein
MHPILRCCSVVSAWLRPTKSVKYRKDIRPPRALQGGRLGPLGASTYFSDGTLAEEKGWRNVPQDFLSDSQVGGRIP